MAVERERPCAPVRVPASLRAAVAGYAWARDTAGESGSAVHRLHGRTDAPDLFLKHGHGAVAGDLADEFVRLRWLARHLPVPAVTGFVATAGEAWLLMTALPGETADRAMATRPRDRAAIVDALAAFLGRLHAIPPGDCPFRSDHLLRLGVARARIDAGLVDEDDFDDERQGWTAEQVWDALHARLPLSPDPVVTHGDFSLDNILVADGAVTGVIDAGRVGIADRYQDLAILWRSLGEFGAEWQARFLSQYGVADPDPARLAFHLLLDELF